VNDDAPLLQIGNAFDGTGARPGVVQGWQQHGRQDRDDSDYNQELDQCKTVHRQVFSHITYPFRL
jgi:hypothetical protein